MKDIIASRRKKLGYTQQQLAEKLNISDKVVSKWETGRSLPDTSLLVDLSEVLEITVNDLLKSDATSRESVKGAFNTENDTKYKNLLIVTMTLQIMVAIMMVFGRMLLEELNQKGDEVIAYIVMIFAALVEIGTITYYLVMRNNLLSKYPTSTALDKQYINRFLYCTYPLVLTVVVVFVVYHGLEIYEQFIASLFFGAIALIPFVFLYVFNNRTKK